MKYALIILIFLLQGCTSPAEEVEMLKDLKESGLILTAEEQANEIKKCQEIGYTSEYITYRSMVVQIRCIEKDSLK
jgi:hypothetical protein